jgi:hypothetical protein
MGFRLYLLTASSDAIKNTEPPSVMGHEFPTVTVPDSFSK